MRIGFDAKRAFNNYSGLGNYSRYIISNICRFYPENECLLYTPFIAMTTICFMNLKGASLNAPEPGLTNSPSPTGEASGFPICCGKMLLTFITG